jgi:prolyl 4-hydroxylase
MLLQVTHTLSPANHWSSPTRVANIENVKLRGGGLQLRQAIWDAAKDTIAEWTHATLHESSLYGIRVYTRGSVLMPHVDRLPLVSSAIICVDTNVEEPWPLEVIGRDGRAYNVTMEPGDMVLCK